MLIFISQDWLATLGSRATVDACLTRYFDIDIRVNYHQDGSPYLIGIDKNISISHCNNILVFALSEHPLGIDLEHNALRDYSRIADKMAWGSILDQQDFYRRWTAYEATFKAHGDYPIKYYSIMDGYTFAVASHDQDIQFAQQ